MDPQIKEMLKFKRAQFGKRLENLIIVVTGVDFDPKSH
jgi:hypothetical protein